MHQLRHELCSGYVVLGPQLLLQEHGACLGTQLSSIGKMLFLAFVDRGGPQTEGGAGAGHGNGHAAPISQKLGHHRARIHELWLLVYAFFRDLAYI